MSRRGNCWDNAVAEAFFGSLKREEIRKRVYPTRDAARADVFDYIERRVTAIWAASVPRRSKPQAQPPGRLRDRGNSMAPRRHLPPSESTVRRTIAAAYWGAHEASLSGDERQTEDSRR